MKSDNKTKILEGAHEKKKEKRKYEKPTLKSQKILEAGLGATCNGTGNGPRKHSTASIPSCSVNNLLS